MSRQRRGNGFVAGGVTCCAVFLLACGGQPAVVPGTGGKAEGAGYHWTYGEGVSEWRDNCQSGTKQSPVAVPRFDAKQADPAAALQLGLTSQSATFSEAFNGKTVVSAIESSPRPTVEFDGERYELAQFHLHTPSEHQIVDSGYPLEVHFVHTPVGAEAGGHAAQAADKPILAVIGVFAEVTEACDKTPSGLETFLRGLGSGAAEERLLARHRRAAAARGPAAGLPLPGVADDAALFGDRQLARDVQPGLHHPSDAGEGAWPDRAGQPIGQRPAHRWPATGRGKLLPPGERALGSAQLSSWCRGSRRRARSLAGSWRCRTGASRRSRSADRSCCRTSRGGCSRPGRRCSRRRSWRWARSVRCSVPWRRQPRTRSRRGT